MCCLPQSREQDWRRSSSFMSALLHAGWREAEALLPTEEMLDYAVEALQGHSQSDLCS